MRRGAVMAAEGGGAEESVELKFRVYDGTDIGHRSYAASTTVATLKERLVSEWPQDKTVIPKSINDLKLIYAGKFLENNKTLAESRIPFSDIPGVLTMHVVVQPPLARKKSDKNADKMPKQTCSCTIL